MNSEVDSILNDKTLRGVRLLRKTSLRNIALDMPYQFSGNPRKESIVRLAGTKYHWEHGHRTSMLHAVYFLRTDLGILDPRWKNPKNVLNHARAQINKAALKLYKLFKESIKKIIASIADPLEAVNYFLVDYVNESAETYKRFANPFPSPSMRQGQLQPKQRLIGKSRYF